MTGMEWDDETEDCGSFSSGVMEAFVEWKLSSSDDSSFGAGAAGQVSKIFSAELSSDLSSTNKSTILSKTK